MHRVSRWFRPGGELEIVELCHVYADGGLALMRASRSGRPIRRADLDIGAPDRSLEDRPGPPDVGR